MVPRPGQTLVRSVIDTIPSESNFVLIGEASHGTDEFYRIRGDITRALITERGFNAVAVEADFPDAFRANLYVRGLSDDTSAEEALGDFIRFPTWMWRNTAVRDFLAWLRQHNDKIAGGGADVDKVGFYGVDVYSMHSSAARVVEYLKKVDPEAANRVQQRYECFDRYGEDAHLYAKATGLYGAPSCANDALSALYEVLRSAGSRAQAGDGELGWEQQFAAECNAACVSGAEAYYRNMFFGDELTWNLRDTHFADTVARIQNHLTSRMVRAGRSQGDFGGDAAAAKIVVWAHNSHLGDASATDMGRMRSEINLGQLMRRRYGAPGSSDGHSKVFNIGFSTNSGTVAAADEWDSPGQRKHVRPGMPGSYEALFHEVGLPAFALKLRVESGRGGSKRMKTSAGGGEEENKAEKDVAVPEKDEKNQEEKQIQQQMCAALAGPLLERAIGVIYRPRTERQSHYFYAELPKQFDLMIHIDKTRAVKPLDPAHPSWEEEHLAKEDFPETYPFAV
jgi:erythromycin esterase-like protein